VLQGFAEDTVVGCANKDDEGMVHRQQDTMKCLYFWMDAKKMTINVKKSHILLFSRTGKLQPSFKGLKTSGRVIQRPDNGSVMYLGVCIDANLSFKQHLQRLA
jgi:hypothetical protein